MKPQSSRIFWIFLIVAGAGWGGSISLTKIAATSGYHPLTLLFWQLALTALILLARLAVTKTALPLNRNHLVFYAFAGTLGTTLPDALAYFIAPNLPAGVISIVYALVPMMTFVLAIAFRCERFELKRLAGVLLGLAAVVLLTAPDINPKEPVVPIWVFLLVMAGLCYAAESIFAIFYMPKNDNPLTLLTGMNIASLVFVVPVMLATDTSFSIHTYFGKPEIALFISTLIHIACYAGYLYLLRHTGAIFASQISYVVTLSGVLWGMIIFRETHNAWVWLALAAAITGLALVNQRRAL